VSGASELAPKLQAWSRVMYGSEARVGHVGSLGGHSGVTIGFDVLVPGYPVEELVLKIPPAGVNRKNNFDVLRQVPLLRALEARDVPAPRARWWSGDESTFGAPCLIMSRLRGGPLPDVFGPDAGRGVVDAEALFAQAIRALVKVHSIDAEELASWNVVRMLPEEIDHWVQVLHKSTNADWIRQGMAVRELLHRLAPHHSPFGLVHGDFYSNNWVFDGRLLTGIVDWEGSSLGPYLLDLGWVCTMYDTASWGATRRTRMGWHPEPPFFIDLYASLSGMDLTDIGWYRAVAGYRLACITAYYYERQLRGKQHPNPAWDVLGESVPFLFERAAALLKEREAG
jgi:aminoglycoside phosphotransferase (APT) family kinase protein